MNKLKHVAILVKAKLRARPGRSALVVLVPSLLFGITLAGLIIINSGLGGIQRFSDATFGGRQYVQAEYTHDVDRLATDKTIQQRAKAIYDTDIARKTATSKKLGIDFDPRTVPEPIEQIPGADKEDVRLNLTAPSVMQAIEEYTVRNPAVGVQSLEKTAKPYSPISIRSVFGISAKNGSLNLMRQGKEGVSSTDKAIDASDDFISKSPIILMDESVMKPFVNADIHTSGDEIPISVPYSAAETIVGTPKLTRTASSAERLERLEYLQRIAVGKHFSVCYRNSVSMQQIDQAANRAQPRDGSSADEIEYALPAEGACAAARVAQDRRSVETKAYEKKVHEFNKTFGIQDEPIQRELTFRVVGLVPDDLWIASSTQYDPVEATRLLLGPSRMGNVTMTSQAYNALPSSLKDILQTGQAQSSINTDTYLVEFNNPSDAYAFIHEQSCDRMQGAVCGTTTKPFGLSAFGSGGVTLIDLKETARLIESYFIGTMIVIATLVMAGTFGRIIADEKHEIAVFRAIGATRSSIMLVYLAYALTLVFFAVISVITIGYGIAVLIHMAAAADMTVAMRLTYGVLDESVAMSLGILTVRDVLFVSGIVCVVGLVSILLPLWGGTKRDIVQDLKEG